MDPIASFSGLASGIDFRSMVDQIIEVESRPIQLYQRQIDDAQARSQAWSTFRGKVQALETQAAELSNGSAFDGFNASVTHLGASGGAPLSAQPTADAVPGSYEARVVQLATREKLGSDVFASRTEALGIEGEFVVGGRAVSLVATDSLNDVVDAINRVNSGPQASGVSASILYRGPDAHSIVLTADETGVRGIALADTSGGPLRALGFLDGTIQVKHQTSDGATSDAFTSSSLPVAAALGLTTPPAAAEVTMGGVAVSLDMGAMSLDDVAAAINSAASGAGSSVTATVLTETRADGSETYTLDVSGTTAFTDAGGILETLGILEAGRSDVAQTVSSGTAFTDGNGSTTASGATLLRDLWVGGTSAGVEAGDTLTFQGTRGDGTTFSQTFTVTSGSTLQDVADALNSGTEGFQAGDRTATASISPEGHLVVTDDQTGGSWLDLEVVAHNEGGGILDFGDFSVSRTGRSREISPGRDALLEVDGTFMTRSSNIVSDAIPGVNLRLLEASDTVATIDITRNHQVTAEKVQAFVQAFNEMSTWVGGQFSGAGAEEGVEAPPLSGDSILRQMRDTLKNAMLTELDEMVGGNLTRFADIGIEINKEGLFDLDTGKLLEALEGDPAVVERFFGVYGSGSTSALSYVSSGSEARAGSYEVEITQAASRGAVTASGFGGSYTDDGTPDILAIRDLGADVSYEVALSDGMSLGDIVQAVNTELATPKAHHVRASGTLYGDPLGTPATDATPLQDLHDAGGASFGVADGDVITVSGTRADGSSFLQEFQVVDVATQTLGDLRATLADVLGSGEVVSWEDGGLSVTALEDGGSSLNFSITSDNAGGGNLSFGTMEVVTEGRGAARITASDVGGELSIQHRDHGSADGFEISFTAGGSDGSASLGLAAGTYRGTDVAGTIGGNAATGVGQLLTGAAETDVEGLMIRYEGADTGIVGDMLFSRGVASAVENSTSVLLGYGEGSIDGVIENIDPLVDRLNDRIDNLETRLEQRREHLIRKFARLEEALAMAQSQSEWLSAQFANLPSYSRESS